MIPRRQRVEPGDGRARHGLPPAVIAAMLERQGWGCLVCRRPISPATAVVDHDHRLAASHPHPAGRGCPLCVRGLLDAACNTMLGMARDDPAVLRAGAAYLELARA